MIFLCWEAIKIPEKLDKCVMDLMRDPKFKPKNGKDKKSSAFAVCTAAMKKAGHMESDLSKIALQIHMEDGGEESNLKMVTFTENIVFPTSIKEINEQKRSARVCVLAPCKSRNNRYYSPEIVQSVVGQLEGKKAFADHDDRGVKNIVGVYREPVYEFGKAFATLYLSSARDIAESVWTRMREGLITDVSIAATGKTKRIKMDGQYVDRVEDIEVASVDLVSEGGVPDAKIIQVFESSNLPKIEEVAEENNMEIKTVEQLKETYPDLVYEAIEKSKSDLQSENEKLQKKVKELETLQIDVIKDKLISSVEDLPEEIRSLLKSRLRGETQEDLEKSLAVEVEFVRALTGLKAPEKKESFPKVKGVPVLDLKKEKKLWDSYEKLILDPNVSNLDKNKIASKVIFG